MVPKGAPGSDLKKAAPQPKPIISNPPPTPPVKEVVVDTAKVKPMPPVEDTIPSQIMRRRRIHKPR